MQLLAIIFLYIGVISLGSVLFQYINIAYPDVLSYNYVQVARESLRWQLAILVIIFPCYVFLMWKLQREFTANPKLRELKVRKWLLYLTVFLATLVIIGDLVTLVYQFLSGGLSAQFILKILAVLAIASSVFLYYGWSLKQTEQNNKNMFMRLFTWAAVAAISVAIIAGFFFIGSPFAERERQFDQQRVDTLSSIQIQIISYWQRKQQLPENLAALQNDISGYIAPVDPESGLEYEYRITGDRSFELCATFLTNSSEEVQLNKPIDVYEGSGGTWPHSIGYTCFKRTIDADLYPPITKQAVPVR